jgi:hypothetical protein
MPFPFWNISRRSALLAAFVPAILITPTRAAAQSTDSSRGANNVVLIMTDGFRWQELFRGADPALMDQADSPFADTAALRAEFGGATAEARRRALLPFFWGTIAEKGQIFGNRDKGSDVHVTNGFKFSYPGYNETLTGAPDPRINSNRFGPNPNVTVFEWLAHRPGFEDSVAAFGAWSPFDNIFNRERSGLFVRAAWDIPFDPPRGERQQVIDDLYRNMTRIWGKFLNYDTFVQQAMLEYVREKKPRTLFVGFGETDEWAHEGRYDLYLRAAHRFDHFVAELWNQMQAMPEYRGHTTFIIATDHGRGDGPTGWRNHGQEVDGAEAIWLAVMGPDTPPLGERTNAITVTQSQIAATIASLLGEDFRAAMPHAAAPIADVLGRAAEAASSGPQ